MILVQEQNIGDPHLLIHEIKYKVYSEFSTVHAMLNNKTERVNPSVVKFRLMLNKMAWLDKVMESDEDSIQ